MFDKHFEKAAGSIVPQTLYIVATPIGNLADITLRALAVLARADVVCAEDTRVTAQLLGSYGIKARLVSVREHNERQMAEKVVRYLSDGMVVAQVSDAGTPAVCDPGARLAAAVRAAGFAVVPVVGASAVMGALSVAGVAEPSFYFHGFLPPKTQERQKLLAQWAAADYPVVAFETPHRIAAALDDMAAAFPRRHLVLVREISKTFETVLEGTVVELQTALKNDANQARGEMVLVLHPAAQEKDSALSEAAQHVMQVLAAKLPTKQAAELAAEITGENKKMLYDWLVRHKNGDGAV